MFRLVVTRVYLVSSWVRIPSPAYASCKSGMTGVTHHLHEGSCPFEYNSGLAQSM